MKPVVESLWEDRQEWQQGLSDEQMARFDGIYRSAKKWRRIATQRSKDLLDLMAKHAELEDQIERIVADQGEAQNRTEYALRHAEGWTGEPGSDPARMRIMVDDARYPYCVAVMRRTVTTYPAKVSAWEYEYRGAAHVGGGSGV